MRSQDLGGLALARGGPGTQVSLNEEKSVRSHALGRLALARGRAWGLGLAKQGEICEISRFRRTGPGEGEGGLGT